MNAATEWKDIVQEAAKGMVILVVMETLMLTRDSSWLEVRWGQARGALLCVGSLCVCVQDHVDYLCCQALMFGRASTSLFSQAKLIFIRSRRLG